MLDLMRERNGGYYSRARPVASSPVAYALTSAIWYSLHCLHAAPLWGDTLWEIEIEARAELSFLQVLLP
jgi:hypothetical protein